MQNASGKIFGHGAYVAPDWTADWLHRELLNVLNTWAHESGVADFASLSEEKQAGLKARLQSEFRSNRYDKTRDELRISKSRAMKLTAVFEKVPEGYIGFVEELPGVNTQGATLEEARSNLKEAVELVLEANRSLCEESLQGKRVIREPLLIAP